MQVWMEQVAFIIKNVEAFKGLNTQICRYIDRLADHLLNDKNDIYSHVLLKMIIGESAFKGVYE